MRGKRALNEPLKPFAFIVFIISISPGTGDSSKTFKRELITRDMGSS